MFRNLARARFFSRHPLSTEELDRSAQQLVHAEKRNAAVLSEGSVARRIQVANVCRRFPQLLVSVADNRLTLTVAGMLAPHLGEDNVEKLLSKCAGKTKREVEVYLVAVKPKPVFAPSIRRQPSRPLEIKPAPPSISEEQEASALSPAPPAAEAEPRRPKSSPSILEPARPQSFNFRFSADRAFKEKLERLAEVLGVDNAQIHMAELLEQALDMALEKKDPQRKLARRLAKERTRWASAEKSRPGKISENDDARPTERKSAQSRYIPSEVLERVFARGEYQCEFVAKDGTRCRQDISLPGPMVHSSHALANRTDESRSRTFLRS